MMHLQSSSSSTRQAVLRQPEREYTPRATILDEGSGWACLGSIDGDPSIKKGQPGYAPMVQEWYEWPRQAETMAQQYVELDARGLNLYLGQCLFSAQKCAYSTALPSRWLWADDVPADAKCTELVQSSASSHQAWLQLDTPLPAKERNELQRRWRKMLGGDACSANAVGMVRAPIGYNTKRHDHFPVRVVGGTRSRFTLASVDAKLPQVEPKSRSEGTTSADWSNLPSGAGLAKSARFKRACQNCPQLKTIILDRGRVALPGKDGLDNSGSMQVAAFVNNLLTLYKPYPEAEIRALALHTLRPGYDGDYRADVDRLLDAYRPEGYRPQATRYIPSVSGEINVCTHQEAKLRGRPAGKSAGHRAQLLRILVKTAPDEFGRVPVDTAVLADSLKLTRRRVLQLLGELEKSGEINSFTPGSRWRGAFVLLFDASERSKPAPEPSENQVKLNPPVLESVEAPISRAESGETANATPAPLESTGIMISPVCTLSERASVSPDELTPRAVVAELLDVLPRERPDPETAEVKRWPVTVQRVIDAIRECYPALPWTDAAIVAAYNTERRARKNAEWNQLRALPRAELEKQLSSVMRTIQGYTKRAATAESEGMRAYFESEARKRHGTLVRYQRELARRPEPVPTEGHTEVEQREFLEVVERDRARQPLLQRTPVAVAVNTVATDEAFVIRYNRAAGDRLIAECRKAIAATV